MNQHFRRRSLHGLLLFLALGLSACMPGQRLLDVRIEVSGEAVAQTWFAVDDHLSEDQAWSQLDGAVFEAVGVGVPAPSSDGQVELLGPIRLVLDHAGDEFAAADLEQLFLKQVSAGTAGSPGTWLLAPGEVERSRPPAVR